MRELILREQGSGHLCVSLESGCGGSGGGDVKVKKIRVGSWISLKAMGGTECIESQWIDLDELFLACRHQLSRMKVDVVASSYKLLIYHMNLFVRFS